MKFLEKHPMYMIATGVVGISLSAIIVKYSDAPSLITAVYRLFFYRCHDDTGCIFKPQFQNGTLPRFSANGCSVRCQRNLSGASLCQLV